MGRGKEAFAAEVEHGFSVPQLFGGKVKLKTNTLTWLQVIVNWYFVS